MPNIKSAMKRVKTSEKAAQRNRVVKTRMRNSIKKFEVAIEGGEKDNLQQLYLAAVSNVDRAASKGVIHKNTSARKKSQLTRKLNEANA